MSGYYDIYTLAPERTAAVIHKFLGQFVPLRVQSEVEYSLPQFSDIPVTVLETADELIQHCVAHSTESHAIYWRNLKEIDPAHAVAFFTADGALIMGLSVAAEPAAWLRKLQEAVGGTNSCVMFEEPPPETVEDLRKVAETRDLNGLSR